MGDAGILMRVQALHDYLLHNRLAAGLWAVFFLFVLLLELSVVLAKFAFGETTDDVMSVAERPRHGIEPPDTWTRSRPQWLSRTGPWRQPTVSRGVPVYGAVLQFRWLRLGVEALFENEGRLAVLRFSSTHVAAGASDRQR